MATVESLVPLVRHHVMNCVDYTMEFWLLQAAREFCRETRYLRQTIFINVVQGSSYYPLSINSDEEVIGVKAAEWVESETPLEPSAPEEIPQQAGRPTHCWFLPSKEIALSPTPNASLVRAVSVSVIKQPVQGAATISSELVLKHDLTLSYGAMARLFAMPKQDWTDAGLASYYADLWTTGKVKAQAEADLQHRARNSFTRPHW